MARDKLLELAAETAEFALKQAVDDSVLSDVPIVGSIVKLYGIGSSIRDRLYTEKVRQFLVAMNDVPNEKKIQFREVVIAGNDETERLVQKIVLVIESQTDVEKSELIANFFLAYLDRVIDNVEFRRALDVTATYFLDDLMLFLKGNGFQGFMHENYEELERRGFANLVGSPLIGFDKTTSDELRDAGWRKGADQVLFECSQFGSTFHRAYHHGARLREHSAEIG